MRRVPARALVAQAVSTTEVFPHCQFLWLASVLVHLTSHQPVNQAEVGKGREDKDNLQNLSALLSWSLWLHVPGCPPG